MLLALASRGVLSGDHFYAVIGSTIIDVDLKQRQATEEGASLTECYDYIPTAPYLDVADGKAVVASEKGTSAAPAINVIDLSNGKVLHAVKYKGEVHGLGFAGDNRVFVLGRTAVVVLDVASGETVQTISMSEDERAGWTARRPPFCLSGRWANSSMSRATIRCTSRPWTSKPARRST